MLHNITLLGVFIGSACYACIWMKQRQHEDMKKVRHQQDAMRNLYGRRYWTRFQGEQLAFITQ